MAAVRMNLFSIFSLNAANTATRIRLQRKLIINERKSPPIISLKELGSFKSHFATCEISKNARTKAKRIPADTSNPTNADMTEPSRLAIFVSGAPDELKITWLP